MFSQPHKHLPGSVVDPTCVFAGSLLHKTLQRHCGQLHFQLHRANLGSPVCNQAREAPHENIVATLKWQSIPSSIGRSSIQTCVDDCKGTIRVQVNE